MRKIKFDAIKCFNIDGEPLQNEDGSELELDMTKRVANAIFNNAATVDELEIARVINSGDEVELTDDVYNTVIEFLPSVGVKAFVQEAILKSMNEVKKQKL